MNHSLLSCRPSVSSRVPVATEVGVPVQIVFDHAASSARTGGVSLEVFRDGEQLVDTWLRAPQQGEWRHRLALAPGSYLVRARGKLQGERRITVTESPGEVLRIELR